MTTMIAPQCCFCKHLDRDSTEWVCNAYPDGIPQSILNWDVDHRQPYRGDHGIQFEPRTRKDAENVDERFKLFEEFKRQKNKSQ